MRVAQIAGDLFRLHHGGAPRRPARSPRRPAGASLLQFLDGMAQPVGLALRALDLGAMAATAASCARRRASHSASTAGGVAVQPAEGIEQAAMRRGVDQRAVVMLAVDFDQRRAEALQHLHADRLVVDEGAGAAVGELHAAQDQLVVGGDVVLGQQRARRMARRQRRTPP